MVWSRGFFCVFLSFYFILLLMELYAAIFLLVSTANSSPSLFDGKSFFPRKLYICIYFTGMFYDFYVFSLKKIQKVFFLVQINQDRHKKMAAFLSAQSSLNTQSCSKSKFTFSECAQPYKKTVLFQKKMKKNKYYATLQCGCYSVFKKISK